MRKTNRTQTKKNSRLLLLSISILIALFVFSSCNSELTSNSGLYTVKGRITITDETGTCKGVKDVKISVPNSNSYAISDSDGYYAITNIPESTIALQATLDNYYLIPDFSKIANTSSNFINVIDSATDFIINNADFIASKELTISQIQGKGHRSPVEGLTVKNIKGVVTQVTTLKYHSNDTFVIVDYQGNVKRQTVGEDGFYMQMVTPDGDPLTSDGIFVSTRDSENGLWGRTKWLESCLNKGKMPNPGDIVTVSGIVEEKAPVDRFNDSTDIPTRTQITATSVSYTNESVDIGEGVVLTYDDSISNDSVRILPFNESGLDSLGHMSNVLESVEGMLVRVNMPIVTGATYYNMTPILADGGKDKNGTYPSPFNEKWLSPLVARNDLNSELLYAYYDCTGGYPGPLPQTGTILTNDNGDTTLTGIMDFSSEGTYMIYPFNTIEGQITSHADCGIHNGFKFIVNPDSFYYDFDELKREFPLKEGTKDIQNLYKPWIYSDDAPAFFTVPWNAIGFNEKNTDDKFMNVAVFNIENYIAQGSKYQKVEDIAKAIRYSLKYPDLIILVEMGDDDDTKENGQIIYKNQNHSYIRPTGVVSARRNYETLIEEIASQPAGIQYDYRQIDPIEFDQAGSPGNNIRVGFMFRTDRIKAYDEGLETCHIGNVPKHLIDKPGVEEIGLTRLSKANTHVVKNEDGKVSLTQSPGFVQNDAFYHSRIPLACKFNFIPTGEDFFAVAAHLYSKGPDAPLYGTQQPPVFTSDIRRTNQAIALNAFIADILEADPNAKIIVGGDMNDFGFNPAIRRLTGKAGGNQILYSYTEEFMPQEEIFTYTFRGNLQQLDHIFVSESLFSKVGDPKAGENGNKKEGDSWKNLVHIPHINSLFSRDKHIQISDHDPLAARIDMSK